ncbi:gliding motility-associated C-terminal domain-containing protein [Hymenobacter bucti]|uniref:Gliding motility-associated C-terminal domain-containing protein n=1 Tax=Hymenobacter bucti TaxID=1844114 RepID=A0ABW4QXW6_9BACT
MQQTADGGYILAGTSGSGISGDKSEVPRNNTSTDYWLVKLNAQGVKQWDRTYGGSQGEALSCMQQTADGGYILGGSSASPASYDKTQPLVSSANGVYALDYWIVKVDARGVKQWDRSFGTTCSAWLKSLRQTKDGGYILGGYTSSMFCQALPTTGPPSDQSQPGRGNDDYWVVKLDAQGVKEWDRTFGGSAADLLADVVQTADGGYLLGGTSVSGQSGDKSSNNLGEGDWWVVKIDARGNKEWDHTYGGTANEELASVWSTTDGGYILAGDSRSGISGTKSQPAIGNTDGWVVKVDARGGKEWDQTWGSPTADSFTKGQQTADGGYLLGGSTSALFAQAHPDFWALKLTAQGAKQWERTYGGTGFEYVTAAQQTSDGGYLVGGPTDSEATCERVDPLRGGIDYWVIKLSPDTGPVRPPLTYLTGDTLLCPGSQGQLTAVPPARATAYLWSTGATTPTIPVTQPGVYSVTVTLCTGGISTGQQQVRVAAPSASIQGDTLLCAGISSLRLQAVAPQALSYRWSTGATTREVVVDQPGTYTFTAQYSTGCSATAQLVVRAAALHISGSSTVCAASGTLLTAVAPGATAYRWSTGATTPTLAVTQVGVYSVVATFAGGCSLSASQSVTLPTARISGDSLLCAGQVGTLLTAVAPGATAYHWSTGAVTPTLAITQAGSYTVEVAYGPTCTSTARFVVRGVLSLPVFSLGRDTTLCEGEELLLQAPVMGTGLTCRWSDGSTGKTLLVRASGQYSLRLIGACDQQVASRTVRFQPCILIPNIITPNGDARNDHWVLQGLAPGSCVVEVYNRWGRQVYASATYHNEWGGDGLGGTYYYVVRLIGTERVYRGWLEVVL